MKYLLMVLVACALSCKKNAVNNMIASDIATIDSIWTSRPNSSQYSVEVNITVRNVAMTALELYWIPGFLIGKVDKPKTGHYIFTSQLLAPGPNFGAFQFNIITSGRRFETPIFYLQY